MQNFYKISLLILTAVIVISFFLPWIGVESAAVGGVTKVLTGKRQASLGGISGYKVPVLANSSESRFMLSIIKIFMPNVQNADKKSYLIWVVPGLAMIILAVSYFLAKNKWVNLVFAIIGIAIFAVASFKIFTTDLDKLVLKVNIAYGLWFILLAYLGIGLLSLINFVNLLKKKT